LGGLDNEMSAEPRKRIEVRTAFSANDGSDARYHIKFVISYELVKGIIFPCVLEAQLVEHLSLSHRRRAASRVASHWHCD